MTRRLVLLLTHDRGMQDQMESALVDSTITLVAARSIPDFMRVVRTRWHELDLAILDADTGSQARVILHAIRLCREELPIVATISGSLYANPFASLRRTAGCLSKPFTADELRFVLEQIGKPETGTIRRLMPGDAPFTWQGGA